MGRGAAYIGCPFARWKRTPSTRARTATIKTYVTPVLGHLPVAAVDVANYGGSRADLETQSRKPRQGLAGRNVGIESILDYAKARGLIGGGENAARWTGPLDQLASGRRARFAKSNHHPRAPLWTQVWRVA